MDTLPKAVSDKVSELFDAIKHAQDDLQMECAEASLNGDFSQLNALSIKHGDLKALKNDIASALTYFEQKQKMTKPYPSKQKTAHTKSPRGSLRVSLAGKTIQEKTIALTCVETLKVFGLERVAKLNKIICNIPLIARTPTHGYQTQHFIDGWYITTHFNVKTAISLLEVIAKELNMPIRLESV